MYGCNNLQISRESFTKENIPNYDDKRNDAFALQFITLRKKETEEVSVATMEKLLEKKTNIVDPAKAYAKSYYNYCLG